MKNEINHFLLTDNQEKAIVEAIKSAENKTTGEIKVHITHKEVSNSLEIAKKVFDENKLYETKLRNAVLIYISTYNRTFTIIGDKGIDAIVKQQFWDTIKEIVIEKFKAGKFYEGILFAVHEVGNKLTTHFPWEDGDKNELPDEISYS